MIDNLRYPVILGRPFLHKHGCHIDFVRNCAFIGTVDRVTIYWSQNLNLPLNDVELPKLDENVDSKISDILSDFVEPTTISTVHKIILKTDTVVHKRSYSMSPSKKVILDQQIDEMLRAGVISKHFLLHPYLLCGLGRNRASV